MRPANASGEIRASDPGDLECGGGLFPFSPRAVHAAVASAARAFPAWRDAAPEERARSLRRLSDGLRRHAERLAERIAREVGKPLWEARSEVTAMQAKIEITLTDGLEQIRERAFETAPGQIARWRARPRGVLAVLGPFNFPGHLVHGHVAPALACGNTVVIKPSEHTPGVGELYAEIAAEAELPPGVLNLVQGDASLGAELVAHPELAGVLFTGSYAVGRRILEATLDQPWKLVALEMGGKNGALVADDADPAQAAAAIAYGATVTAGQRCTATGRVIVMRAVAGPLIEALGEILTGIRIGYALDTDVFMGPLISAAARERHARLLERARAEGAELRVPGGPVDGPRRGHYVRPSLHRVPAFRPDSAYQLEEHFVPDLSVLEVDSFEEGIARLGATPYGLAGAVFTRDRARYEQVARECRLGILNWNTSTVGASSRLPFGGQGRSGNDRPAGVLSTLYCSYPQANLEVAEPSAPPRAPGFPEIE